MEIQWRDLSEKVETLLSFDPGGTTGYCLLNRPNNFSTGLLAGQHHIALWELLNRAAPGFVICEIFDYQRRDIQKGVSLNIDARNYIGIIELWCLLHQVPLYMSPLVNKAFWSDSKLKKVGLYPTSPHQRDAIRHMLHYLTHKERDDSWLFKLK